MTKIFGLIGTGAIMFGGLGGGSLVAQSATESTLLSGADPTAQPAASQAPLNPAATVAEPPAAPAANRATARAPEPRYTSALDGSGPIDLDHLKRSHVQVGATVTTGWDSNPQSLSHGDPSATYTISPYFEFHGSTPRTRFLMQYQPTFGGYSGYSTQTMHVVSGRYIRKVNARWLLTADGTGSHGEDSLRLNTPLRNVSIGSGAGANPNAASYLPNAGVITDIEGGAEFSSDLSPRSSLRIRLANSYTSVPSWAKVSSVAEESVSYQRALTSTWGFLAYQKNQRYYGSIVCSTIGGGAGLQWQPRRSVSISASAGPQIDTPACKAQQGFAYNVAISASMSHSSQVYVYAAREPASGYLGPGLWQDGVTAGYRRRVRGADAVITEAGFTHSSSLLTTGSYQGIFFNASYTHALRSGVVLAGNYRTYTNYADEMSSLRNLVFFSLAWTPRLGSHTAH